MIRIRRKDNRARTHIARGFDPRQMLCITLCGRIVYTKDYERQQESLEVCDACARIASMGKIKGPQ